MIEHRPLGAGPRQVARQAVVVALVHQQRQLPVEQVRDVGHQGFQAVHRKGNVPAVKMPAVQHTLGFGIDNRVVIGTVQFDLDERTQPVQAVGQHAQHMRCAAQRIAILQAMQRGGWRVDGQVLTQPRRHLHLARMRLGGEQALVEVLWIALQRHHIHRGDAGGQLQQVIGAGEGQAGNAGHDRRAVHQRQCFLGAQHQRRPAQFAMHVAGQTALVTEHHLALTGQGRGHVRQWRQITAGTHRAFFRDQRQHVLIDKRLQTLEQFDPYPGNALTQRLQARRQHRAGGLGVEQFAQPAAVKRIQMTRQRLDMLQRHRHHAGIAITGGDAVDHAFLAQQRIKKLRAPGDACAKFIVALQRARCLTIGQGQHVFDTQGAFAEHDRVRSLIRHRTSRMGRN
ncbi:hypothetical protein ALP75_200484 [Pseudomonas syringae pv. actinidiae]|nr:hypothetical protein ALP75_200484 [Pseudomonas syringae pv. actinidiae]